MKKIFLLILFFHIFPYFLVIRKLFGYSNARKFYHKIINNFDDIKFIEPMIYSKDTYYFFMEEYFNFSETKAIGEGILLFFNLVSTFISIFVLCILFCIISYEFKKYFLEKIFTFLYFGGLCSGVFFGRELKNYIKIYKGLIFEDSDLNKEFLALINFHRLYKILGIMIECSSFINFFILCIFLFKYKNKMFSFSNYKLIKIVNLK